MSAVPSILRAAADDIVRLGWCQFTYRDESGCLCGMGAVITACGVDPYGQGGRSYPYGSNARLVDACRGYLTEWLGGPFASWNDEPGRTQDQVVAALRQAADDHPDGDS